MSDTHILVANSDVKLLKLLHDLLNEAGFETTTCLTDGDTYAYIRGTQPSLVVLDVGIAASATGWPLLKLLQFDPHTMHIPVLITTVDHQFIDDKMAFLQAKGYDALELPASFDELVTKITHLLEAR
jgi:DNA-binding response OmpR family regulator